MGNQFLHLRGARERVATPQVKTSPVGDGTQPLWESSQNGSAYTEKKKEDEVNASGSEKE